MTSSSTDVELLLRQCEDYVNDNDIMNLVKQCLHSLCIHQPENPVQFLKQYFSGEQYDQVRHAYALLAIDMTWTCEF